MTSFVVPQMGLNTWSIWGEGQLPAFLGFPEAVPCVRALQKRAKKAGEWRERANFREEKSMVLKKHGNLRGEVRVNFLALFAFKPHIFMCGALKLSGIVRANVRLNIAITMLLLSLIIARRGGQTPLKPHLLHPYTWKPNSLQSTHKRMALLLASLKTMAMIKARSRGGVQAGDFFVLFCPFLSFFFPICPGTLRGFSRLVRSLFLSLLTAPMRKSPERVRDTIWTFTDKSGKAPGLETPPGLASLKMMGKAGVTEVKVCVYIYMVCPERGFGNLMFAVLKDSKKTLMSVSWAGNGCANFTGARDFLGSFCRKPPCP